MNYVSVFKNASYQTAARILLSGTGFIIAILIARTFGANVYGDYIKITSFVALFYLFCDFGINAIFLQQKEREYLFSYLLTLRLVIASALFVIANFIAIALPYDASLGTGFSSFVKFGILIFSLELFVKSIMFSANAVFQKKLKYNFWTKAQGIGSLISIILVGLLVYLGQSLYFILFAMIISGFISAGVALFYTNEKIFPLKINVKLSKELVVGSLPLGLMLIFNLIYFRVDSLILASFKSSSEVGIYGLSYLFYDFLLAIPLFFSNSIYPILLEKKENIRDFFSLIKNYFIVYLGLSFLIIIPFWFMNPLFVLIRPEFSSSVVPFRILLLGLPFFFLTSLAQWALVALGETKYLLGVYFLLMCANILFNFVFIPQYSYLASATITIIGEALVFVFLFVRIVVRRHGRN